MKTTSRVKSGWFCRLFTLVACLCLLGCRDKVKEAAASVNSGAQKLQQHDYDGAIADFGKAVELTPDDPQIYNQRSIAKTNKGDLDGAIADATKAIALKPDFVEAYGNRGIAEQNNGQTKQAIADFTNAIQRLPNQPQAYGYRGKLRQAAGDYAGALEDYDKVLSLQPAAGPFLHLYRYILLRRLGREPTDLAKMAADWDDPWAKDIGLYLTGKMNETDFLAAVNQGDPPTRKDRLCQAEYFAGIFHLFNHDLAGAHTFFSSSSAIDGVTVDEFQFSRAELASLEKPLTP